METIIPYCTAGIGNRLRSLASCGVISEKTNRKLLVYWDNKQMNGCLAKLDELFENEIETIEVEDLENLENCAMCVEKYDADREEWEFGVSCLKKLTNKFGVRGKDGFNYDITEKNIVVFNIQFLNNVSLEESHLFLKKLKPKEEIQKNIDKVINDLNLSKDVIGIHARGSDFGVPVEFYIDKIKEYLQTNPAQKFFLSTEDKNYEDEIIKNFPNNILIREKNHYIIKNNDLPWSHKSFTRDSNHVKEAIEDMYILASTNIQIYHSLSTFCEIARIISN
jgi:hypothetical protein